MSDEAEKLLIPPESFEPFILCLALGVIEAIKSEVWSTEAGIWTIRRPIFFGKLAEMNVPVEIIETIDVFDELSAIEELCGKKAAQAEIERIEKVLKERLENFSKHFWQAKWSKSIC